MITNFSPFSDQMNEMQQHLDKHKNLYPLENYHKND